MRLLLLLTLIFSQSIASDYIDIYTAYTNGKRVIVEGRIIDIKDKKEKDSNLFNSFFTDEKKEVDIWLELNSQSYRSRSDDEGYFFFDIEVAKKFPTPVMVSLKTDDNKSLQKIELFQPSSEKHIGVISDFDDTLIVSDVTSKIKLFYNTFFKNYKERELVEEVKEKILTITKAQKDPSLFLITGSPNQFLNNINNFLDYHSLPKRVLLTKKIHGSKSDKLLASVTYKYDKIVQLIEMYPYITWVLFGDSGEKDKEIYLKVFKNYPTYISAIYIRNVETKKVELIK